MLRSGLLSLKICEISNTPSRRGYQLVREDMCYGWSDNGPIAGDIINPTNSC